MSFGFEGELEMTETIQQLKEDISILQEKLRKLEAQQEPEMTLKKSGDCDMVSYDHKYYYRLSFGVGDYYWYKRYIGSSNLMKVEDPEEHRLVEELYEGVILDTGGVVEEPEEQVSFVPKEIKELVKEGLKWCKEHPNESVEDYLTPKTPEKTEQSLKTAFKEAQQTEKWKETQKKIDTPKESWMNKPVEELVEMLEKNPPDCLKFVMGKSLEDIVTRWWCDTFTGTHEKWSMEECIDDLIDQIELFLPRSQSSEGTQSVYTEVAVEAHNELLQKIKSKLRNKK
jgi:hypothetical protein